MHGSYVYGFYTILHVYKTIVSLVVTFSFHILSFYFLIYIFSQSHSILALLHPKLPNSQILHSSQSLGTLTFTASTCTSPHLTPCPVSIPRTVGMHTERLLVHRIRWAYSCRECAHQPSSRPVRCIAGVKTQKCIVGMGHTKQEVATWDTPRKITFGLQDS